MKIPATFLCNAVTQRVIIFYIHVPLKDNALSFRLAVSPDLTTFAVIPTRWYLALGEARAR